MSEQNRFDNLTFSDFKKMANDPALTCYEKIGFPTSFRKDKEDVILRDILNKLSHLNGHHKTVLDIGSGCSELAHHLIKFCEQQQHELILIDSEEMLAQLPNHSFITKIPAFYPTTCKDFIVKYQNKIDVILVYSVLQYVFVEGNLFEFMDDTVSLLATSGQLLVGDLPNACKRKRFLNSAQGIKHHQEHYDPHGKPHIDHMSLATKQLDDGVILGMLMRYRHAGYDAYVVPQATDLPMANRREDLLIIKP